MIRTRAAKGFGVSDVADLDVLYILGGSGRVGRLMPFSPFVRFLPRDCAGLPKGAAVLMLSGITEGSQEDLAENSNIAQRVAAELKARGARLCLFASTQAVYGPAPPDGAPEDVYPEPISEYGAAKLAAEKVLAAALEGSGVQLVILRLGNVVGADQLAASVSRFLNGGPRLKLDRFADQRGPRRSMLTAADLLKLAQRLALIRTPLPRVLNVAAKRSVSMENVLHAASIPFEWVEAPLAARQDVKMRCWRLEDLAPDLMPSDQYKVLGKALFEGAQILQGQPHD